MRGSKHDKCICSWNWNYSLGTFVDRSMKELLMEACIQALEDAGNPKVDAVFVGNFMGGAIYNQEILALLSPMNWV